LIFTKFHKPDREKKNTWFLFSTPRKAFRIELRRRWEHSRRTSSVCFTNLKFNSKTACA